MKQEPRSRKKRVLIVDDHPMSRDGVARLIEHQDDLEVGWHAENAAQALDTVNSQKPDLALVDIGLPDKNGIELIKDFKSMRPELPVLVLSMHDDSLYAERALRAGARGYITKRESGPKVLQAIRQVLGGQIYVSEKTSARIIETFSGHDTAGPSPIDHLSDREFEVFELIGRGLSAPDIGQRLCISAKTVEAHRVNIRSKLGIGSAAELIAFAARWSVSEK